jgi:hypothetical protein
MEHLLTAKQGAKTAETAEPVDNEDEADSQILKKAKGTTQNTASL